METKRCPSCGEIKPLSEYYTRRSGKLAGKPIVYCKVCKSKKDFEYRYADPERARAQVRKSKHAHYERVIEYGKLYHVQHRETRHAAAKKRLEKARKEMLDFFGHDCEICGENLVEFLTVDHIAGNGAGVTDRKAGKAPGWYGIWNECNKAGWTDSLYDIYRILCFNCNCARDRRPNPYQDIRASLGASKALECTN
jgi:hypothetical protein